ncbi:MAG: large subunit ribosomal protein L17 [Parcubacteria group bacterium Gr01-1014_38]|nr:MAG: large subunit ribosomal protein L17 [Parcubacteria group bacterium Gr01-1014_38]
MRHRRAKFTLSRTPAERRALARKLGIALITHGKIATTPARAQFVRQFVEPLVTTAKANTLTSRRRLIAALGNRQAAALLLKRADAYRSRPGGYTRMTRLPTHRSGDHAPQVLIEFV